MQKRQYICLVLPYISANFFPRRRGKTARPDEALVWTQKIPCHSGSTALTNVRLVNTFVVMSAFYCQDLGKAALGHSSEVKPCRHLLRQDRLICFPYVTAHKPALSENYRSPCPECRLLDLLEEAPDKTIEGKQSFVNHDTASKLKQTICGRRSGSKQL